MNGQGNAGFFGYLDGTIINTGFTEFAIQGSSKACTATITSHGSASAVIFNCYAYNGIISGERVGGLVDNFNGNIISCWSYNLSLYGSYRAGMITGYTWGNITNCYATDSLYPQNFIGSYENSAVITSGVKQIMNANDYIDEDTNTVIFPIFFIEDSDVSEDREVIDLNSLFRSNKQKGNVNKFLDTVYTNVKEYNSSQIIKKNISTNQLNDIEKSSEEKKIIFSRNKINTITIKYEHETQRNILLVLTIIIVVSLYCIVQAKKAVKR